MGSSATELDILDTSVQKLENLDLQDDYEHKLKLLGLDEYPLDVGIDLGSELAYVAYDHEDDYSCLNRDPARNLAKDKDGSCRIETVAAAFRRVNASAESPTHLFFGVDADRGMRDPRFRFIAKVEMMKFHLLSKKIDTLQDEEAKKMMEHLKNAHEKAMEIMRDETPHGHFCIYDPLLKKLRACKVETIKCIIRESLEFILQSTKANVGDEYNLRPSLVETLFKDRVKVAVSVPTVSAWDDSVLDDLRELLHDAGL